MLFPKGFALRFVAGVLAVSALPLRPLLAQGVAGASLRGTVVTASGSPVPGARIALTNASTGNVVTVTTRDDGTFDLENVSVGGPYTLETRALGFEPASISAIVLHVGDRMTPRIVLSRTQRQTLDAVMIRGSSLRDAGAGGPAYSIPGEAVRQLPLLNRDFVGLLAMAPQATGTGALSVSGQHVKFNAVQVDGGSSVDFFQANQTPGGGAGARSLSLEALEEIRVLVAPFDVRQGGFSGGLINAVTRSGTNRLRGSSFVSLARAGLVGTDTAGASIQKFNVLQYGLSLGGAIIPNRLHYFVAADLQSRTTPFVGFESSDPNTGISDATARRAEQIFRDTYGFEAGGPEDPILEQPNKNLFAKISWQRSPRTLISLSETFFNGRNDVFNRSTRSLPSRAGWQLSRSGFVARSKSFSSRLAATTILGSFTNELVAGAGTLDDGLQSVNRLPLFLVQADKPRIYLAGGSVKNAQDVETDQRVIEITDNVSWSRGAHLVTAGTQNQLLHFRDNFFLGQWGVWTFGSDDLLERAVPLRYEVALPLRPGGPLSDYSAWQLAGYLQDRWDMTSRFTFTAGLRADVPFIDSPYRNADLASNAALGNIDTGSFPSGNTVISPRVGFSYVVGRNRESMIRGGIGAFEGHPPYVWLTSAFANTGKEQSLLVCNPADGVPAPTTDITHLPSRCLGGTSAAAGVPSITYFANDFRFQQAIKLALGVDHAFGGGLTASLDVIRTTTSNTAFVNDVNLVELSNNSEGRVMYGRIAPTGIVTSARVDSTYGAVYRFDNRTGDRATAVTAVVDKRWSSGGLLEIGYNWSRTYDLTSLANNNGPLILQNNPVDGSLASRNLRTSARDIPHNLVITAVLPPRFGVTSSVFFRVRSGAPYAYVVSNDANADGVSLNDLAFVPRSASDITLTNPGAYSALDSFIQGEECLRTQRGQIMQRNTCRNPGVSRLDVRLGKPISFGGTRAFELTADIFNLPNLLHHQWGLMRETIAGEALPLLAVAGWDAASGRPVYTIPSVLPSRNHVLVDDSRWRIQLGGRYNF
jgi:Carboxypeptidase regulatory-like domain/TonB dependent receptor